MAKVTLTIDDCEDGVKLTLESDPPIDMVDNGENTDAQTAGLIAMGAIQGAGSVSPDDVECMACGVCRPREVPRCPSCNSHGWIQRSGNEVEG